MDRTTRQRARGAVPLRLLLARTDDVAVALIDVSAFSTGLQFRMEVRLRAHDELIDPFGMRMRDAVGRARAELPDEVLRFGSGGGSTIT